jgi:predicted N-acetyltransferase YhbS
MDIAIRQATGKDVPAVRGLLESLPGVWQESWRPDVLERAISSADGLALVAFRREGLVGFVCAHDVGFRAYVSELAVAESEQRSGLGTELLRRIEEKLVERGCAILIADVYPPAEAFYRKLGWSPPDAKLLGRRLR